MNRMLIALAGAGLGAGTMYLLDPDRGRGRRVRLREATRHAARGAAGLAGMTARDVRHRASGLVARALDRLIEEPAPADQVVAERVRARLGRLVAHPHALRVAASNGKVTLAGPVFEAEVEQLMKGVAAVAGVTAIEDKLELHRDAGHIPALQGAGPRKVAEAPARWLRWTPTARLAAGLAGIGLVALSAPNRTVRGTGTSLAGMELLEHAVLGART